MNDETEGVDAEGRCRRSSSKTGRGSPLVHLPVGLKRRYYRNQEVVADMVNKSAHNKRPHDATSSEVQELAN